MKVTYNGRSGSFQMAYKPNPAGSVEQFIRVSQDRLQEYDSNGKAVGTAWKLAGSGSFLKEQKEITSSTTGDSTKIRRLTYTAAMKPTGNPNSTTTSPVFTLYVYIGDNKKNTTIKDSEAYSNAMEVPAATLKFCIKVENWAFQSTSNFIGYHMYIEGSGDTQRGSTKTESNGKKKDVVSASGAGEVVFPREVEVKKDDGTYEMKTLGDTALQVPARATGTSKKRSDISLMLPYSKTSVRYDPDVVITAAKTAATSNQLTSTAAITEEVGSSSNYSTYQNTYQNTYQQTVDNQQVTESGSSQSTTNTTNEKDNGLPDWAIGVIVVLCVLVFCVGIGWLIHSWKKKSEKNGVGDADGKNEQIDIEKGQIGSDVK